LPVSKSRGLASSFIILWWSFIAKTPGGQKGEASPAAEVLKKMANALDVSTDYLMNGTTSDLAAENIQDKTLINQFNRITELSTENKIVVSKLIDAFLFQQEMKQKLAQ
jgi:transcriptional regulator with XRE-family HTH domain